MNTTEQRDQMIDRFELIPVLCKLDSVRQILSGVELDFFERWNPDRNLAVIGYDWRRYGSLCYAAGQLLLDMENDLKKLGLEREWGPAV